jgi:hypothetical protein
LRELRTSLNVGMRRLDTCSLWEFVAGIRGGDCIVFVIVVACGWIPLSLNQQVGADATSGFLAWLDFLASHYQAGLVNQIAFERGYS